MASDRFRAPTKIITTQQAPHNTFSFLLRLIDVFPPSVFRPRLLRPMAVNLADRSGSPQSLDISRPWLPAESMESILGVLRVLWGCCNKVNPPLLPLSRLKMLGSLS